MAVSDPREARRIDLHARDLYLSHRGRDQAQDMEHKVRLMPDSLSFGAVRGVSDIPFYF